MPPAQELAPTQVTTHAHALLQSVVFAQLLVPLQVISQRFGPHAIWFAHDPMPLQLTMHSDALPQLTPPPHALVPQLTSQGTPAGQLIVFEQPLEQLNTHVPDMQTPFAFVHDEPQVAGGASIGRASTIGASIGRASSAGASIAASSFPIGSRPC